MDPSRATEAGAAAEEDASELSETTDAERAALHALLFEHREGLVLADVAVELRLSEARAEELLRTQEVRQLIRSDIDEERGALRYVTLRVRPPSTDARTALAKLEAARSSRRDAKKRGWGIAIAVVVAGAGVSLGWVAVRRLVVAVASVSASPPSAAPLPIAIAEGTATRPSVSDSPITRGDELASARQASAQGRAWAEEVADLERRAQRLEEDAHASGCAGAWSSGGRCYVSNRLMTRAVFDDERARLALRVAQLRRLLEESR
jgi:hypothetical protein